jgi:hypothetical protein
MRELGTPSLLDALTLWGAKIRVLPGNRRFLGARTEFWHPTGNNASASMRWMSASRWIGSSSE